MSKVRRYEIRYDDTHQIDEIVVERVDMVHIEMLDDDLCAVMIYPTTNDGEPQQICVKFSVALFDTLEVSCEDTL